MSPSPCSTISVSDARRRHVADLDRPASAGVVVPVRHLPRRVAGEQPLLADLIRHLLEALEDLRVERADRAGSRLRLRGVGHVALGPAAEQRMVVGEGAVAVLRVLDLEEGVDRLRGERQQVHDDAVGELVRIARGVLGSGDARLAADRVEHVGGQHHVQHLLHHHRADTSLASSLPCRWIEYSAQRYGGIVELELDRRLEQLLELVHVTPSSSASRWSAVRSASAAIVSVGFEVPSVGKLPRSPRGYRLRCSHERCWASTTESSGRSPIRCVPPKWPIP